MNETPRCTHCGRPVPENAVHCPVCGAGPKSRTSTTPSAASIFVMVVFGAICAIPFFVGVTLAGLSLFGNVGPVPNPAPEFYVPWAPTGFFLFVTLLAVVGLIVVARRRMPTNIRAFVISFLCVSLGLFSLCDIFALSTKG